MLNRSKFIATRAGILTSGAGLLGYATLVEPHWLEIVERDLPVANLPPALNGKTLAHISDLHACSYVDEDYLEHSLDRVKPFAPDIVAVTGDFVTWEDGFKSSDKLARLDRVLAHLPKGRLATLGIMGNHDYGLTWKDPRVAALIIASSSAHNLQILRNEVATVEGLDIIGLDDLWSGRTDTRTAFAQRTSDAALVMCHNPDALDELPWEGYAGWVLAGHTHGGQCKAPFLPPPILPVKNRRYSAGEIAVDSERTLYISRGVGHLLKARFLVRPEITMFTLRPATAS
jgi:predicted MPP superfamily phosphohydrolase